AVTAAHESEPGRRGRDAAPLRLRGPELPDAPAARDVDRADRAVVVPALQLRAEGPVRKTKEDVAEDELVPLLRRSQLCLHFYCGGLGGRVEDVVHRGIE